MPIPTQPSGFLYAAGAKKATTWGTAVQLGSGNKLLIESLDGLVRKQDYIPAEEADTPIVREGDLGPIKPVNFSIGFSMRYDPGAIGTLIALLFGIAGTPTQQGTTSAYKHTIKWKDVVDGLFATFAAEFPNKIFEVPSCKVESFELNLSGGLLKGTIGLKGNKLINDSSVNTDLSGLTAPDIGNRIKAIQGVLKMNAQTDGDVRQATALIFNDLKISFKRNFDEIIPAGADSIIEPAENGRGSWSVSVKFPRFNSQNEGFFQTAFVNETEQKMLIEFTGPIIADTYAYKLSIYFPRLRIIDCPTNWKEIIDTGLELVGEEAETAPTGMSDTRAYIELVNKQSTDYLA